MTSLDTAILNVTEWLCRRFQLLTGRTNVWLAVQFTNLSIVIYFAWAGLYLWISSVAMRVFVGLFCATLLYALTQTVFKVSIEAIEASAYRRAAKGLRNPRRLRDAPLRISFLTLSLLLGYPLYFVYVTLRLRFVLLSYLLVVLTTVILYLMACDPLPPSAGKVRAWLQRAVPLPRAAEVPGDGA
jgi:hypothetical protein